MPYLSDEESALLSTDPLSDPVSAAPPNHGCKNRLSVLHLVMKLRPP